MNKNIAAFLIGLASAFGLSAIASVPQGSVAIQDEVSEIRVKRQAELTADQDLRRLSDLQLRYRENMPLRKRVAQPRPGHRGADRVSTSRAGSLRKPVTRKASSTAPRR